MRYFIVFYTGVKWGNDEHVTGSLSFEMKSFPNRYKTESEICLFEALLECIITNIIEVSENDFNEWVKE